MAVVMVHGHRWIKNWGHSDPWLGPILCLLLLLWWQSWLPQTLEFYVICNGQFWESTWLNWETAGGFVKHGPGDICEAFPDTVRSHGSDLMPGLILWWIHEVTASLGGKKGRRQGTQWPSSPEGKSLGTPLPRFLLLCSSLLSGHSMNWCVLPCLLGHDELTPLTWQDK